MTSTPDNRPECSGDPAREGRAPDYEKKFQIPVMVPDRNSASGMRVEWLSIDVDANLAKRLDACAIPATGAAEPDAVRALDLLIKFAYAAWNAIDNSEQRDDGDEFIVVDKHFGQPAHDALEALDGLPDDQPGYIMGPIAKVQWALRSLSPAPAVGVTREAMRKLLLSAKLLQQNSEACAANHYGNDCRDFGMPGWLADTKKDIEAAEAALSPVPDATVSAEPVAWRSDDVADATADIWRAYCAETSEKERSPQGALAFGVAFALSPQDVGREATIEECARLVESTGLNNKSNIARDIRALSRNGGGRG